MRISYSQPVYQVFLFHRLFKGGELGEVFCGQVRVGNPTLTMLPRCALLELRFKVQVDLEPRAMVNDEAPETDEDLGWITNGTPKIGENTNRSRIPCKFGIFQEGYLRL